MDYQNRAGSKKGTGGIASEAQQSLHRRKQVDDLLRNGDEIPYAFQGSTEQNETDAGLRKNPYIYKNNSGKIICKLCNTMHMSWSSVERHLSGKKHGLNLLRRGGANASANDNLITKQEREFQLKVEEMRQSIKHNGIVPKCDIVKVKHPKTGHVGLAVRVNYCIGESDSLEGDEEPYIRITSGIELPNSDSDGKKFLMVAFEPFENIAIEIPNLEIVMNDVDFHTQAVDELNKRCSYWDKDDKTLYIQFFFKPGN